MCGIAGIVTTGEIAGDPKFRSSLLGMTRLLQRRGPDDEGFWSDQEQRVHFGFRRLSVIDTSAAGHQPMISHDGRSAIVLNGEIYNFPELRRELEGHGIRFRSRTDTEVLLEALNLWGMSALQRLNGMFAFAWYDIPNRRLLLARDHAGIKPLYYYVHPNGKGLAFASQYNALLRTPWGSPGPIRHDVLRLLLQLHHIPPPFALLENSYQLEPGSYLTVDAGGKTRKGTWWQLPEEPSPTLRGDDAVEALQAALDSAVRRQRIADVPLGVFLSGGVDSPLITAIARKQTGPGLKAYTIGNPGWRQDESADAAAFALSLDVQHSVQNFSTEDILGTLQDVAAAQYEPFGDFSILPTLMISRLARNGITVALSGDGGDELFFGYERPLSLLRNGSDFRWPQVVRMALYGAGRYGIGPRRSEAIIARTAGDYYFGVNCRMSNNDVRSIAPGLGSLPDGFRLYESNGHNTLAQLANYSRRVEFYGQLQRGLKKVDMASMYHSLEVRVPLLDREVIDLSLQIDPFDCMRNGTRKAVLRDLLGRYVPATTIPAQKRGFAVPLHDWLKGAMRPIVEQTLFEQSLFPEGLFDVKGLRAYWNQHVSGERDHKWGLWTILSLQWWAQSHLEVKSKLRA